MCTRKLTNHQDRAETTHPQPSSVKKVESLQENNQKSEHSSETVVKDLLPIPKSSVQFHLSWSSIKADKALCFRFLKVNVHTFINNVTQVFIVLNPHPPNPHQITDRIGFGDCLPPVQRYVTQKNDVNFYKRLNDTIFC